MAVHGDEVLVLSGLQDSPLLDDEDAVRILNRRQTMREHDRRPSLLRLTDGREVE